MEFVIKGACKFLGDCKPGDITKELKKKQKDMVSLEAAIAALCSQVADLKVELGMKDEEICQLKVQAEGLDWIRDVVGT